MKPGLSISETQQLLEQLGAGSETLACLKKLQSLTSTSVRILSAPPGVAGFVMPGQSRAMFINLYTALFATPEFVQRVVRHEDMHLRHQEMMNMEIPFFHELQDIHVQNFTKALRENPFDDLIGLIEGFTEGAVALNEGRKDPDVAYTHDEVPMVERFDRLVVHKSGGSLMKSFAKMNRSTRGEFLTHMRTATNVMMLEKVCFGFIDPDREVFPPRGTPLDDFQKMCAWYQEKFPAAHVIRTEEEAKRMLQVHEDVHLLTLAA